MQVKRYLDILRRYFYAPIIIAILLSYCNSRLWLVGSGAALIPWGVVALSWGLFARKRSEAVCLGGVYGFFQAFVFLWVDKAGRLSAPQFLVLLVITTLLGLLAALSASLAAWLSYIVKRRTLYAKYYSI